MLRGVSLIALCLVGCGIHRRTVPPTAPSIRYVGWFDRREPEAVRFSWPGSQVELAFAGSGLTVSLTDTPVEDEIRETDWLTVRIDDGPATVLPLAEGTHVYQIASELPPAPHRALLWKRTEAEVGVITLNGFAIQGASDVQPALPARTRRLVFIGDSITAGYGNEGHDATCPWSAATEDNFDSYGAHAARELAADYMAAAWSGKGVVRNFDRTDELTLPKLWTRVIPTEDASPDLGTGSASAVIINLGTNDFAGGQPSQDDFVAAYRALLADVKRRFPGAAIVLALGPMLFDDAPRAMDLSVLRTWLHAIQDGERLGSIPVSSIEFPRDPAEGLGCDYHPNERTHARMGRELATHLRNQLGW